MENSIKHVYDLGLFDFHTIAAHCVHVDDEDIDIMAEKMYIQYIIRSNLKLASDLLQWIKCLKRNSRCLRN